MEPKCQELRILELSPFGQTEGRGRFFELLIEPPDWEEWRPGQFVMLRPSGWGLDMLWARPFSICRVDQSGLTVFFQTVGRGTRRMAGLVPGDTLTLWGPLGNGFAIEPETKTLLLAGGMGLAPFVGYCLAHPRPENLRLLFGRSMPLDCYPFHIPSARVDSEEHEAATLTELAEFVQLLELEIEEYADGLVLACGPAAFLESVKSIAMQKGARAQLSLENRMACGVGACLGCVVQDQKGWPVQVCSKGPVFWADEIKLGRED